MTTAPDYELLMFQRSHFNEKARWALDWKRIPHRRTPFLPGPHGGPIRKLTGQTQVPVLVADGEAIPGSARIIEALEQRHPEPALYPSDSAERERALAIQTHFDDEVGPKIRRAMFSVMVEEPAYLASLFAGHKSAPLRWAYGAVFPLVKAKMKHEMQIEEPHIGEAFEATRQAFAFVEKEVGPSGYLVGDRFSIADLTAAAILAPGVVVDHPDMHKPASPPPAIREFLARWASLPGAAWVQRMYADHRPGRA
ncbi:MAG: glutathione S-transferase family protein [Myxococcota bacterium]